MSMQPKTFTKKYTGECLSRTVTSTVYKAPAVSTPAKPMAQPQKPVVHKKHHSSSPFFIFMDDDDDDDDDDVVVVQQQPQAQQQVAQQQDGFMATMAVLFIALALLVLSFLLWWRTNR